MREAATKKMLEGLFELVQMDVPGQKLRIFLNGILDEVLYNPGEFEDNPSEAWEHYCKELGEWWQREMEAERVATELIKAYVEDLVEAYPDEFDLLEKQ